MPLAHLKGKLHTPQLYEVVNLRATGQAPSESQDALEDLTNASHNAL